jgi:hypothetical protein
MRALVFTNYFSSEERQLAVMAVTLAGDGFCREERKRIPLDVRTGLTYFTLRQHLVLKVCSLGVQGFKNLGLSNRTKFKQAFYTSDPE